MLKQNMISSKPYCVISSDQKTIPLIGHRNFLSGGAALSSGRKTLSISQRKPKQHAGNGQVKARVTASPARATKAVKAFITELETVGGNLFDFGIDKKLDNLQEIFGKTLLFELVAAELDPKTGLPKPTVKGSATVKQRKDLKTYYESNNLNIPNDFGEIGAILIENELRNELFIKSVRIDGLPNGDVEFACDSWIHSKHDNSTKRIFFSNKSFLPSQTPSGLQRLRSEELDNLRGNGTGIREHHDRIYDYDVYNDLGDPDKDDDLARPVLGGKELPYPRRCRTGRLRTQKDPTAESRTDNVYVPRDESFSEIKQATFSIKTVASAVKGLIPTLKALAVDRELPFPYFTAIDQLYNEGVLLPDIPTSGILGNIIPRLVRTVSDGKNKILRFETPELMDRDKFAWFSDSEFARQALAGLNPCCIKLVTKWPLVSTLDPAVYGPPESAFTEEMVVCESKTTLTFDEILSQKRLFIIDYHDVLMPYVERVRQLEGASLYGSRLLFFLTDEGTLRPLAIELTRPPLDGKPQWKRVFLNASHATGVWLWRLAKAHFLAHDSGFHQLISHWLRTHCCTEPYIIAMNRQLSAMHPIYRLLNPHFRYTMEINALARESLINADGVIEGSFSPRKYSLELSAVAYDLLWRFDLEALPADLISRGMAEEDPASPHGLKLTIADYPYATDGLLIWDAIKEWVNDYVKYYYPDDKTVQSDTELQAWWTEVRTKGHGDKKDEPWWLKLDSSDNLIHILTTIIWVASAHHAAVNFGQYHYAGYFPNRPTISRSNMPVEDPKDEEKKKFMERPEEFLMDSFPTQIQAATVLTVLDVLSTHSPDEEYLGGEMEPSFADDKVIKAAFERFGGRLKEIEGKIDAENADPKLRNRNGAGLVPYELLKPYSEPGVTGKGIPNSVSI